MPNAETVLVTGATGLVGGGVLRRMLHDAPATRAYVLVRDTPSWQRMACLLGSDAARVIPVIGDLRRKGLGIEYHARRTLTREVTLVVHSAADTNFSRPISESRLVNTEGTRELLALCRAFGQLRRFAYVSTAYVAGRREGIIRERDNGPSMGWVNAYERSKYEAEAIVRRSDCAFTIFRPSTIACDGLDGRVTQVNAVHRALRVYHRGLAAMMPGRAEHPLDLVTTDYVVAAITRLALDPRAAGKTVHLCAGKGAINLGDLLDAAYEEWSRDPLWRRRALERVMLTDLATYTLFADSVAETGDVRLAGILKSLSHFVPQLALPKVFDTTIADSLLGCGAPRVSEYWSTMISRLMRDNWGAAREAAA